VDNVKLIDRSGRNLVQNGDFSGGNDHWFFSTDNHLPWHIKNVFVQMFFDQGLFGLLGFCAMVTIVLVPLFREAWRGEAFQVARLAGLAGFLVVGIVDSLFDSPRMALVFFFLLLLPVGKGPQHSDGRR
jgi:predicted branched-subunit amino acid permease